MAQMNSWIEVKPDSDFPIQNIPFGIFSTPSSLPRCGVAIGDFVLDLSALHDAGLFNELPFDSSIFGNSTLNAFMELERPCWRAARARVIDLLSVSGDSSLRENTVSARLCCHIPYSINDTSRTSVVLASFTSQRCRCTCRLLLVITRTFIAAASMQPTWASCFEVIAIIHYRT